MPPHILISGIILLMSINYILIRNKAYLRYTGADTGGTRGVLAPPPS